MTIKSASSLAIVSLSMFAALTVSAAEPSAPATPAPAPATVQQPAPPVTIGTVDIGRATTESALGKSAQTKIKDQQAKLQKQVDAKKRQLEKMRADIERQMQGLTPQQREAKGKEFQKKVEEFQKFGMGAEKELMATQDKLSKEVFTAIEQAAATAGKKRGVAAVVIKRELLYLGQSVQPIDITDDVLALMPQPAAK
jgi:outer membrane protein